MANDLNNAVKNVAEKIVKYVDQVATLTVETRYVEIDTPTVDFEQARPVARTVIRLDGDCDAVLPMRRGENGSMAVDGALFELHERNVTTAIDYRTRMMAALLQSIKQAVG